jgi:eukaryotic-like serine/threonine-protein kinase
MSETVEPVLQRAMSRVGSALGEKYTLEDLVGVGGTAAVYRAVHRNGNRVAVKMLHLEYALDTDIRSRFLSEGYASNNIDHPGAVRVLDDDTADDGSVYLVMELLEGSTLDARAAESGGMLSVEEVLALAHQLLDVLSAAHAKGTVHRDVKPENLFLTVEGVLKILDFGIARVKDPSSAHATVNGQIFGTPAFLPPEQALGEVAEIDHRTDLWAVGATMFTLLTGEYVYGETSPAKLIALAATTSPRSVRSVAPALPVPVAQVVDRALARDKHQRWSSARQMQSAVEAAYLSAVGRPLAADRLGSAEAITVLGEPAPDAAYPSGSNRVRSVALAVIAFATVGTVLTIIGLILWLAFDDRSVDPVAPAASVAVRTPAVENTPAASAASPVSAVVPASSREEPPAASKTPKPPAAVPKRTRPRTTGAFDYQ